MLEMISSDVNSIIKSSSGTDKLSSQLGKYRIFFYQLGIGLFNWVSLCLIPRSLLVIGYFVKANYYW